MENKKVVVALGRNAFSESFPKQHERVKMAAKAIADLVEEKYEVIITHSNGPQVGMIQTAMTEYSRLDADRNCCSYVYLWSYEPGLYWLRFTECY